MTERPGVLLVFAKAPVAGQVKTRLIPDMGQERALSIYTELLTRTLHTASKARFLETHVYVSGDVGHAYFRRYQNQHAVKLYKQQGQDLGQRMFNAFQAALDRHPYAVLIGSDCPSLTCSDLTMANDYLQNNADIVLGPAADGGYYLIGLKNNHRQLFTEIKWGKEDVFIDTCAKIAALNWDLRLLSKRWDVDTVADLVSYNRLKKSESAFY